MDVQSLERSNSGLGGVPRLRTGSGHLASTNLVSGGSSSPHGGSLEAALASLSGSGSVHDGAHPCTLSTLHALCIQQMLWW